MVSDLAAAGDRVWYVHSGAVLEGTVAVAGRTGRASWRRCGTRCSCPTSTISPLLAQYYISQHSEEDLQRLIRQELELEPLPQPTRRHELLAALPLAEIWTTNYDDLIERAMAAGARIR